MEKVILFGLGQVASATFVMLTHDSPYQVAAFTVDREYLTRDRLFDLPVVPFETIETICPPDEFKMLVSISFRKVNQLRSEKYYQAKEKGYELINYISSKAIVWPDLTLGDNCAIGPNCTLGPFVKIGNNVSIGSGTLVGHHTVIKDHCTLAGNVTVSGSVTIQEYCFIGANATLRDRINIAPHCVIGAGAVILEDTRPKEVYLGKTADLLTLSSDELPLG